MTASVYVVGGAGAGKSTFVADFLAYGGYRLGSEARVLHERPMPQRGGHRIKIRGHEIFDPGGAPGAGTYLGRMREEFPGTDALDKVCSPTAVEWATLGDYPPGFVISEGARLSSVAFLSALAMTTDLLVVWLDIPFEIRKERVSARPKTFSDAVIRGTGSRAEKLVSDLREAGVDFSVLRIEDSADVPLSLHDVERHVQ